jgi:hypothetical protein
MSFGWFQELLAEIIVPDLTAAEVKLVEMLDCGAMIVHVYREADREHPELVGRHRRLRCFYAGTGTDPEPGHEIERLHLEKSSPQAKPLIPNALGYGGSEVR